MAFCTPSLLNTCAGQKAASKDILCKGNFRYVRGAAGGRGTQVEVVMINSRRSDIYRLTDHMSRRNVIFLLAQQIMVPAMVRKSRDLYQTGAVLGANHIDECCFPLSNVPSHVSLNERY